MEKVAATSPAQIQQDTTREYRSDDRITLVQ